MAAAHRKVRRKVRRNQRKKRRDLNKKLKAKGMSWGQRRRIIRTRRRSDRSNRKQRVHKVKQRNLDRELGKHSAKAQARRRRARKAAMAPRPPMPGAPAVPSSGGGNLSAMWESSVQSAAPAWPVPGRGFQRHPAGSALARRQLPVAPMLPAQPLAQSGSPFQLNPAAFLPAAQQRPLAQSRVPRGYYEQQVDPYYDDYYVDDPLYDPYSASGVDVYDDYVLVDVDGVDRVPREDQELWSEWQQDVVDVATELAGELAAVSVSGPIGADPVAVLHDLGQKKLVQLKLFAEVDGWNPVAYQRDAEVVVEAVNELAEAMEDATLAAEDAAAAAGGVAGVHVGAAGMALASIPVLASIAPKLIEAKQNREDRQVKRRRRRRRRQAERQAEREASQAERIAELEAQRAELEALGAKAGVYDMDDGEWGARATAGGVSVRAKVGKRAALAELGNGYYLVKEVAEGVSEVALVSQMQAAAAAASSALSATPAAIQGPINVGGCGGAPGGCGCGCSAPSPRYANGV